MKYEIRSTKSENEIPIREELPVSNLKSQISNFKPTGFTLIELLVAVGLFTVVMVVSIASLTGIINADRKSQSLQSVVNGLAFSLDEMARTIRTGTSYHCSSISGDFSNLTAPSPDSICRNSGSDYIAVRPAVPNPSGGRTVYWFSEGTCLDRPGGSPVPNYAGGCIQVSTDSASIGSFSPLTAPEVSVDNLTFYVIGAPPSNLEPASPQQPRVVMTLKAHVDLPNGARTDLNLQTDITQRVFDQ